ncbi:MAG: hypothetical protein V4857_06370 [Pseudomonadota bacterium]
MADIVVGFTAAGDSGFLIGTGAFDVSTTCFTVDKFKVCCRASAAPTSPDPLFKTGLAILHFLHLYITLLKQPAVSAEQYRFGRGLAGSVRGPHFWQKFYCKMTAVGGENLAWLGAIECRCLRRVVRRFNQSWPWPPTRAFCADQEPNLLDEKQRPQ